MERDANIRGDFSSKDAQMQTGTNQDTVQDQLISVQQRIGSLEGKSTNIDTDVWGLFEVVSAVPAGTPSTVYDQIKIYTSGGTFRFYWYDYINHAWRYATGT